MFKLDFSKSKFVYLICLLFFSYLNHAQKTLRIGYVNMDYILENLDDYKTATEEYEIRLNMWKKEISEREVEIENKLKELEIQRPLLTETLYNDFREEIDFEKEQLELYRQKRFGANGDWLAQEKILIQPIQDEVLAAVQGFFASKPKTNLNLFCLIINKILITRLNFNLYVCFVVIKQTIDVIETRARKC